MPVGPMPGFENENTEPAFAAAWLIRSKQAMINTDLKTRAKRLRVAVKNVLGAEITNSQALELVDQDRKSVV